MIKGLGDLGNMAGMMKQAMEMKGRIQEIKETLGNEQVEATAGGGMVTVVMNGKMQLLSVKIDPEIVDKEETAMLETLVQAACNEAVEKVQDLLKEKMAEVTGGIDIPGLTT